MRRLRYLLLIVFLLPLRLPVLALGFLCFQWHIWRQRGRVSGTAYEPFGARLCYHLLGSRPDPLSWQLAAGLPATGSWCFRQLALPLLIWPSRLTAYTPSFLQYPPERPLTLTDLLAARTEFHDRALAAADDLRQFVVLGAGWDTAVSRGSRIHRGRYSRSMRRGRRRSSGRRWTRRGSTPHR